jgi:hypothetical protein
LLSAVAALALVLSLIYAKPCIYLRRRIWELLTTCSWEKWRRADKKSEEKRTKTLARKTLTEAKAVAMNKGREKEQMKQSENLKNEIADARGNPKKLNALMQKQRQSAGTNKKNAEAARRSLDGLLRGAGMLLLGGVAAACAYFVWLLPPRLVSLLPEFMGPFLGWPLALGTFISRRVGPLLAVVLASSVWTWRQNAQGRRLEPLVNAELRRLEEEHITRTTEEQPGDADTLNKALVERRRAMEQAAGEAAALAAKEVRRQAMALGNLLRAARWWLITLPLAAVSGYLILHELHDWWLAGATFVGVIALAALSSGIGPAWRSKSVRQALLDVLQARVDELRSQEKLDAAVCRLDEQETAAELSAQQRRRQKEEGFQSRSGVARQQRTARIALQKACAVESMIEPDAAQFAVIVAKRDGVPRSDIDAAERAIARRQAALTCEVEAKRAADAIEAAARKKAAAEGERARAAGAEAKKKAREVEAAVKKAADAEAAAAMKEVEAVLEKARAAEKVAAEKASALRRKVRTSHSPGPARSQFIVISPRDPRSRLAVQLGSLWQR